MHALTPLESRQIKTTRLRAIDVGGVVHSLAFAPFADSAGPDSGFSPPPSPAPFSVWGSLHSRPPPAAPAGHDLLRLAIGSSDATHTWRIQVGVAVNSVSSHLLL